MALFNAGHIITWINVGNDNISERVISIKEHNYGDEPSLIAVFLNGKYAALYNCELSDFKISQDISITMGGNETNTEITECLISWPKGTIGYQEEKEAIEALQRLIETLGFGRLPQLLNDILKIRENPSLIKEYTKTYS